MQLTRLDPPNELNLPRSQLHIPRIESIVNDKLAAGPIIRLPYGLVEHIATTSSTTALLDHLAPMGVVSNVIVVLIPVEGDAADAVAGAVGILVVAGQVVGVHPLGGGWIVIILGGGRLLGLATGSALGLTGGGCGRIPPRARHVLVGPAQSLAVQYLQTIVVAVIVIIILRPGLPLQNLNLLLIRRSLLFESVAVLLFFTAIIVIVVAATLLLALVISIVFLRGVFVFVLLVGVNSVVARVVHGGLVVGVGGILSLLGDWFLLFLGLLAGAGC